MTDPLRATYEALPHRHGAVPDSHPARIGVIARLFHVPAPPMDHARVLELGCGEGMNLLPMAERFPGAEFVGVDFSPRQIATGEAARVECGLKNVRLICADLREFDPEAESFDYIIAHGVYSWVPDEVKDRLMELCRRTLRPAGVAYVSYNVMPGWGLLGGLRRVLLAEVPRNADPEAQAERIQQVLQGLAQGLAAQPGAYAALAREHILEMRKKPYDLLLHDELELINDPRTFLEFNAHAERHGLHYLAEAHFATMPFEHLPVEIRNALTGLRLDFLRAQQFLDVLCQRWLRNSLLIKNPVSSRTLDFLALRDAAFGLRLRAEENTVNVAAGETVRFLGRPPLAFTFEEPMHKAILAVLAEAAPHRVMFHEAVEQARGRLVRAGINDASSDEYVCRMLARLFAMDALDVVLAGDGTWLRNSDRPGPSPLMRWQGANNHPIANRWHEPTALTTDEQRWLADPAAQWNEAALAHAGLIV